jgi:hypothetical protein
MGSFAASVADDYKITDVVEDIIYTPVNRNPTVAAFTIHFADPHEFSLAELSQPEGLFHPGDRMFYLGANQFPAGVTPQGGDQIKRPDGTIWIVKNDTPIVLDDLGISWLCPASKAR